MTKISLYDIFTGSATTKWLEPSSGVSLEYSDDHHSIIIGLTGTGPGGTIDIGLDPNPTLGGDLNLDGHLIISNDNQDIIIQPGTGGQIILDGIVFPDTDGQTGDLLGTDGNGNLVWYQVPGITNSQAGISYYVDQAVPTTGDGSKELPFKTFQEALDLVQDGDTVVMYGGTYTGDHTIGNSITVISIDNSLVRIFGNTTIPVGISVKTVSIILENNTDVALSNSGSIDFNSGSLVRDNAQGVINDGTLIIRDALIKTQIGNDGLAELYNVDSDKGLITTTQSLVVYSAIKAPMIDHVSGTVEVRNSPMIDFDFDNSSIGQDVSIKSTSNTGLLVIDQVSFKQVTGWSTINKTGSCEWVINNVGRNPLIDTLAGSRKYFITEASDLSSYYEPTNYSINSAVTEVRDSVEASITNHLNGIDDQIGNALSTPNNIIWVATNGNNFNNGSFNRPFSTLSHAIAQSSPNDTIMVAAGQYSNETIVVDKNLNIIGFENPEFTESTMELSNGSFLVMDHILISSSTDIPLVVSNGGFQIYNSKFETGMSQAILIDSLSSDSEIIDSYWDSDLQNNDSSGHKLVIRGVNSELSNIISDNTNAKTYIRDSALTGQITHSNGYVSISNVGQISADGSGKSLLSTADNSNGNFLFINLSSTKQDDGSYGIIEKTGNCDYQLGINDIGTSNILIGDGGFGLISSDQVTVNYTPVSYTATESLTDHITKIDQLLSDAVIKPSRLYYVDTIGGLNEVYYNVDETTFGFDSTIYITPGAIAQFLLGEIEINNVIENFNFKPGVNLIGTGSAENVIVQMPTGIPNLHITSAISGMIHETLWRDIKLNSPVIVELSNTDDEIHFENMTINGDITVNYGKIVIRNSKINGILTIAGGIVEIWNSELLERVLIGDGELYLNGVKQHISSSFPSFDITGGNIIIENLRASNDLESIFKVQGGKTIVSSLIIDSNSYNTVIYQDIGGSIYVGINNIVAEGKTVNGTVMNLGFGL